MNKKFLTIALLAFVSGSIIASEDNQKGTELTNLSNTGNTPETDNQSTDKKNPEKSLVNNQQLNNKALTIVAAGIALRSSDKISAAIENSIPQFIKDKTQKVADKVSFATTPLRKSFDFLTTKVLKTDSATVKTIIGNNLIAFGLSNIKNTKISDEENILKFNAIAIAATAVYNNVTGKKLNYKKASYLAFVGQAIEAIIKNKYKTNQKA